MNTIVFISKSIKRNQMKHKYINYIYLLFVFIICTVFMCFDKNIVGIKSLYNTQILFAMIL